MLLCYLEFLQQGNTIKLQVVKVATLKAYLAEAATWITNAGYPDPRFFDYLDTCTASFPLDTTVEAGFGSTTKLGNKSSSQGAPHEENGVGFGHTGTKEPPRFSSGSSL